MTPINVKKSRIKLIGRREYVDFPQLGLKAIEAKIDTGAYSSSMHCEMIGVDYENSKPILYFTIDKDQQKPFRFEEFGTKKIRNSFGEMEERFVIKTIISLGGKNILSSLSLTNRDNMRYPVLIGRRIIKGKFVVDPNQLHTAGIRLHRAFIQLKSN